MAKGNLKGITVEINGETGPLQNALKDVNKTSYNLKGELKEVERALKLDPTNTVLLGQKQELLAKSITNTKEKLETLKTAEAQAQEQFLRGEISAEQYRGLQREVIATQQELGRLETAAEKSHEGFKKAAESAAGVGDKIIVAGVAALGSALVGTAVAGVTVGDELVKALNGIEAATGYSKESMSSMEDVMLNIYNNNFGENFEDIGKAIEEVAKQTSTSGEELEMLTTNALMMRDTFEFDVTESIRSANMIMTQFGLTGEESYNLIAQGAQWGLDKNGDLLDTINEYSGTFKAQGFSAEEMFNMLQNGAASGTFSVDKLGDSMKEFGIRSKDGSKTSAEGFIALGLDAGKMTKEFGAGGDIAKAAFEKTTTALFAMKDPVAQNAAGVALFGTQWEDMGVAGIKALTETRGEISTSTDALKGINDVKYNSFGEGMEGIKRQLITGLALPIGKDLLPKMNEFSKELKEKMPGAITKLKPILENLIDKVVFLASHLNIIIPIISGVVAAFVTMSIVSKIAKFVDIMTKAFSFLSLAKLKDIGQTTILNALYVKDAIVKGASAIAQGALSVATGIWNIVCGIATGVTTGLGIAFTFLTGPIGLAILAIAAVIAIGVLLYKNWDTVKAFMIKIFKSIVDTAVNVFNSLVEFFKKWGPLILAVITGPLGLLVFAIIKNWNNIKSVTLSVFNGIKTIASNIWNGIKSTISGVVNGISSTVSGVWNGIKSTTSNVWNGIKNAIMTPINAAKDGVKNAIDSIKSFFSNLRLPEIKIPKIKLPHFSMEGKFSLAPPQIPSFGVKWYDKGGVFNGPSVIGVGEKRPEFVGALDDLRKIVREESGNESSTINFNGNYSFAGQQDIDYFMNKAGQLVQRRKG